MMCLIGVSISWKLNLCPNLVGREDFLRAVSDHVTLKCNW